MYSILTNKYIIITRSQSSYECVCSVWFTCRTAQGKTREMLVTYAYTHIYSENDDDGGERVEIRVKVVEKHYMHCSEE